MSQKSKEIIVAVCITTTRLLQTKLIQYIHRQQARSQPHFCGEKAQENFGGYK